MDIRFKSFKIENLVRKKWKKIGLGDPENDWGKIPFSMIMPPPNANGSLHMGHALMLTIEDIFARYNRMRGKKVLWLPGFDHAGFETLVVFEKELEKKGLSRFDFEEKKLYKEIFKFVKEKIKEIRKQEEFLGISCSFKYEKFTLDKDIVNLVIKTFEKLKKDKLVEEGERLVNWCPKHQTAFSDLEVVLKEKDSFLYYIKYGPFTVATTRPETILADVGFAANPKDSRYSHFNKKIKFYHPILEKEVEFYFILDDGVDPNFGTGVLKITPGHDFFDFELAKKYNLPYIHIFDERGRINLKDSIYYGLKKDEARKLILEKLKEKGLLEKIEPYKTYIPVCYKCETEIEPRPMKQWFLLVDKKFKLNKKLSKLVGKKEASLKEITKIAIEKDLIQFYPERFKKAILVWLENLKDWNISRQIVWGIKIPGSKDVFDTWFSSSQWPVITIKSFGRKLQKFYPTTIMETGYDILYFWVSRMIFMGLYLTGEVPFKKVYLHGLLRDEKGQKMSKSKGNVINPLEVAQKYGIDSLRISFIMQTEAGKDVIISEKKFIGAQRFLNKVWNASRFIILNKKNFKDIKMNIKNDEDFKKLMEFKKEYLKLMEELKISIAFENLYKFFWFEFADKIIEKHKDKIYQKDKRSFYICFSILKELLKMLHPFMPFLTEYLWQELKEKKPLCYERI
jgi:valyl-tRNA synthetase